MKTVPVIAFFNNKGGVGKTTLVQHLAHMYAYLGIRVLVADLDPQANLTSVLLDEDTLVNLWDIDRQPSPEAVTIYDAVRPQIERTGDITPMDLQEIQPPDLNSGMLWAIPGDLRLSYFEETLSKEWADSITGDAGALRVTSAFWRIMQQAAQQCEAAFVLVDIGPNLGAINRAALIASDYFVVPMSSDMFSLQGLRNLGPTIRKWRSIWADDVLRRASPEHLQLPQGTIQALGYIITQHNEQLKRPVRAYKEWIDRIPSEYQKYVLYEEVQPNRTTTEDANFLGYVRHYRSLSVMAQDARKPIFFLRPADGAVGAHTKTVHDAEAVFRTLSQKILERVPELSEIAQRN
jgi:chromosome partitioning protein